MSIEGKNFLVVSHMQGYAESVVGILERRDASGVAVTVADSAPKAVDSYDPIFAILDKVARNKTPFAGIIITDRIWPDKQAKWDVLPRLIGQYEW